MVIVFTVVPKNSGLRKYRDIGLGYLSKKNQILEVRGEDVPFWVSELLSENKNAIGLTGEDLYSEYCLNNPTKIIKIIKKISWQDDKALFGKPALCLIGPRNTDLSSLNKYLTVAIPSKYKRIASDYLSLLEAKGYRFRKMYLNGSIEATCAIGLSDIIIDIVYSGKSIVSNGLKIYEKILDSDFVIIGGDKYDI